MLFGPLFGHAVSGSLQMLKLDAFGDIPKPIAATTRPESGDAPRG